MKCPKCKSIERHATTFTVQPEAPQKQVSHRAAKNNIIGRRKKCAACRHTWCTVEGTEEDLATFLLTTIVGDIDLLQLILTRLRAQIKL